MKKRSGFRAVFMLLCWEGAFATAYDTWIGSTYISGMAGELGVGIGIVTLLSAMPWLGQVGQFLGIGYFQRVDSVKSTSLKLAVAARAVWTIPLFMAGYWGLRTRYYSVAFPKSQWLLLLAVVATLSAMLGSASAVAWNSWMKGLVPETLRGRFAGARQCYGMIALILANGLAAAWVNFKPHGYFVGYGIIGLLAVIVGGVSLAFANRAPDIELRKDAGVLAQSTSVALKEVFRNEKFRSLLIFAAAMHGAVQMGGPYFPYYFTKELHISMQSIAVWAMLTNLGYVLSAGFWGKKIDLDGPKNVLWKMGNVIALAPLVYVLPGAAAIRWIAPFEYFANGVFWCGYNIALSTLLFRTCPKGKNAAYFSVYAACFGIAGAAGTLLGGSLAETLSSVGGFRALWVVTTLVRLGALWGLFSLLSRGQFSLPFKRKTQIAA